MQYHSLLFPLKRQFMNVSFSSTSSSWWRFFLLWLDRYISFPSHDDEMIAMWLVLAVLRCMFVGENFASKFCSWFPCLLMVPDCLLQVSCFGGDSDSDTGDYWRWDYSSLKFFQKMYITYLNSRWLLTSEFCTDLWSKGVGRHGSKNRKFDSSTSILVATCTATTRSTAA